jgi:hypothetical protein
MHAAVCGDPSHVEDVVVGPGFVDGRRRLSPKTAVCRRC